MPRKIPSTRSTTATPPDRGTTKIPGRPEAARLKELFQRNGYVRTPRDKQRREIGVEYKKGWEARLVLRSEEELHYARRLLKQAGFKAGRPFKKTRQWAQPVYGKDAVAFFRADKVHRA